MKRTLQPGSGTTSPAARDASGTASAAAPQLLDGVRRGDETAVETLVRDAAPRLLRIARRILNDERAAQDAVQSAFRAAFESLSATDGGGASKARLTARRAEALPLTDDVSLSAWLRQLVVTIALAMRGRNEGVDESIEALLPEFTRRGAWSGAPIDWTNPRAKLSSAATRELVQSCVDRLPRRHRDVFLLREIDGMDAAAVADVLGISVNATKLRLHRARQALKSMLESHLAKAA